MLETVGKKDGAIVGFGTYEVSEDGQMMTAKAIVFDRSTVQG